MKVLLLSGLLFISTLNSEKSICDNIQLELSITNTTEGRDNGKIEVEVVKGKAPYKVFLFASKPKVNLVNIKIKDLKNLPAAEYLLIVQDQSNCRVQQTVIIK
jgi:hypothetical protein